MSKYNIEKELYRIYKNKQYVAEQNAESKFNEALNNDPELKRLFVDKRKKSCENIIHSSDKNKQASIEANEKFDDYVKLKGFDFLAHYECSKCNDKGWIGDEECECRKRLKRKMLKQESNLPKLATQTFEDDKLKNSGVKHETKIEQIIKDCKMFTEKFDKTKKRILLLSGGIGVGKTTISYFVANELINKEKSVYYSNAFDLSKMLLDEQFRRLANYDEFENAIGCDFLIIDDLGVEPKNAILMDCLFALIDKRLSDGAKTMICTNLTFEQISQRYGERIYSRLLSKEFSYCPNYIAGEDLRKKIL